MTRRQRYLTWGGSVIACLTAFVMLVPLIAQGANTFANPAFETQWNGVERVVPNFWGPLTTARDGQPEPYIEGNIGGDPGRRLVQYFDKARMEMTTPNGTVTNGLLTVELKSGAVQLGNTTFQQYPGAPVGLAGDAGGPGPTYASLARLPEVEAQQSGSVSRIYDAATNDFTTGTPMPDPNAAFASYLADPAGRYGQNIPKAFTDFLARIPGGAVPAMGYPISPAFQATVRVGGRENVPVVVQAFERRVLTYTPSNQPAFQVEFGNIGQHYYQWRYVTLASGAATPTGAFSTAGSGVGVFGTADATGTAFAATATAIACGTTGAFCPTATPFNDSSYNATSTAIYREYNATNTAIARTGGGTNDSYNATSTAIYREYYATSTAITIENNKFNATSTAVYDATSTAVYREFYGTSTAIAATNVAIVATNTAIDATETAIARTAAAGGQGAGAGQGTGTGQGAGSSNPPAGQQTMLNPRAVQTMAAATVAGLPADLGQCGDFSSQAVAQAYVRRFPSYARTLDSDGDGVACEGNPPPYDYTSYGRVSTPVPTATSPAATATSMAAATNAQTRIDTTATAAATMMTIANQPGGRQNAPNPTQVATQMAVAAQTATAAQMMTAQRTVVAGTGVAQTATAQAIASAQSAATVNAIVLTRAAQTVTASGTANATTIAATVMAERPNPGGAARPAAGVPIAPAASGVQAVT